MEVCGAQHPELAVTCVLTGPVHQHPQHVNPGGGRAGGGMVSWPNDGYMPRESRKNVTGKRPLDQARKVRDSIERNEGLARDQVSENTRGVVRADAPSTSEDAADHVWPRTGSQRWRLLTLLWNTPDGLTDEQMSTLSRIAPNSQRPRRVELVEAGWVVDSGERRETIGGSEAIVWVTSTEAVERLSQEISD